MQYQKVTNLERIPIGTRPRNYSWGCINITQRDDGYWQYGDRGNSYVGLTHEPHSYALGNVVVAYLEFGTALQKTLGIYNATTIISQIIDGNRALLVCENVTAIPQVCINGLVSCTPLYSAIYTPNDWTALQNAYETGTITSLIWTPAVQSGTGQRIPPLLGV